MRWFRKLLGWVNSGLAVYTLLVYALCYWPSSLHWITGFMMLSLPLLLILHAVILTVGVLMHAGKSVLVNAVMLLLSFPFWARTYQFPKPETTEPSEKTLRVLSFNVRTLGVYTRDKSATPSLISPDGLQWLKAAAPDVICLQESYQGPAHDLISVMKAHGYPYAFFAKPTKKRRDRPSKIGLSVFSRYPLTAMREESFGPQNGLLGASVIVGTDTISVINIHLHSMTLRLYELAEQKELDGLKTQSRLALQRMKEGFTRRKEEVALVEKWIEDSKHPVIVCGDFNEVPYSYSYGKLTKRLRNAFEERGKGFGFTYNQLPYFIRIDNQFYDPDKFELHYFKTDRNARFSDHYPLLGDYELR